MKQLKTNETYTLPVYLSADCPSKIIDIKEEEKQQPGFARKKNVCAWSLRIFFFIKVCGFEIKKGKKKKKDFSFVI